MEKSTTNDRYLFIYQQIMWFLQTCAYNYYRECRLDIVEVYKFLQNRKEFVLSKRLLRSGTSIGANIEESQAAQSKKDFISKLSIANKEARETLYWLRLLSESKYIDDYENKKILFEEINSIINLLTKIIKTLLDNK